MVSLSVILKSRCFFVATSVENQMRVITVVLNADQSHEDDLAIFKTTNQLLQYLLINFQKVQLIENNKPVKTLSVLDSSEKTVKLVAQNSLFLSNQYIQRPKIPSILLRNHPQ